MSEEKTGVSSSPHDAQKAVGFKWMNKQVISGLTVWACICAVITTAVCLFFYDTVREAALLQLYGGSIGL